MLRCERDAAVATVLWVAAAVAAAALTPLAMHRTEPTPRNTRNIFFVLNFYVDAGKGKLLASARTTPSALGAASRVRAVGLTFVQLEANNRLDQNAY